MHYAILAMSKYGIKRDFTINFEEIDTPTEKERAEINEIKARTDASYIQAGVFSPDEVRDNVVKDANSGYNDIVGELEDNEEFSFTDEPDGGSETSQSPFSMDDDEPKNWFTSNGAHIPVEKGETQNQAFKETTKERREEEKQDDKNSIIVKGDELGKNLSGQALRDKAEEYYKNNLANTTCENKNLGIIKFSPGGFDKPISASGDERKLKLFPFLPEIIRTGKVGKPTPDRYKRPNVKAFYTITKTIQFEGEPQKIGVNIREDNNRKLYYDHFFADPKKGTQDSIEFI